MDDADVNPANTSSTVIARSKHESASSAPTAAVAAAASARDSSLDKLAAPFPRARRTSASASLVLLGVANANFIASVSSSAALTMSRSKRRIASVVASCAVSAGKTASVARRRRDAATPFFSVSSASRAPPPVTSSSARVSTQVEPESTISGTSPVFSVEATDDKTRVVFSANSLSLSATAAAANTPNSAGAALSSPSFANSESSAHASSRRASTLASATSTAADACSAAYTSDAGTSETVSSHPSKLSSSAGDETPFAPAFLASTLQHATSPRDKRHRRSSGTKPPASRLRRASARVSRAFAAASTCS
mmetsp:Transcript_4069/g.14942  ORF Transcript_4069/g.14942 Transcript_4069/m.14942 type:complete len:309 (+) Transcript_4069:1782-2708(+)